MKKLQDYLCQTEIGKGQFGTVYKAIKKGDPPNTYYAIKSMARSKIDNNELL